MAQRIEWNEVRTQQFALAQEYKVVNVSSLTIEQLEISFHESPPWRFFSTACCAFACKNQGRQALCGKPSLNPGANHSRNNPAVGTSPIQPVTDAGAGGQDSGTDLKGAT